jgi:hypothetical protein
LPDDVLEEMLPKAALEVSSGAFLVFGAILETFPDLLQEWADRVCVRIGQLTESLVGYSCRAVTRGIRFIGRGMARAEFPSPELLDCFFLNLQRIIDHGHSAELVGSAISAMSFLLKTFGLELLGPFVPQVIAILDSGLHGGLHSSGIDQVPQELHEALAELFDSIIRAAPESCGELIGELLPVVFELSQSESFANKLFALDVLSSYAEVAPGPGAAFLGGLLGLALAVAGDENGAGGFNTITKLVKSAPDLVRENVSQIIELVNRRLLAETQRKSTAAVLALDTSVACLGAVAMGLVGDDFPLAEYVPKILMAIPARIDKSQNLVMFQFLIWICNRPGVIAAFAQEILGPFVRLFAQPLTDIEHSGLNAATIEELRVFFANLLTTIPDALSICAALCSHNDSKISLLQLSVNRES